MGRSCLSCKHTFFPALETTTPVRLWISTHHRMSLTPPCFARLTLDVRALPIYSYRNTLLTSIAHAAVVILVSRCTHRPLPTHTPSLLHTLSLLECHQCVDRAAARAAFLPMRRGTKEERGRERDRERGEREIER